MLSSAIDLWPLNYLAYKIHDNAIFVIMTAFKRL